MVSWLALRLKFSARRLALIAFPLAERPVSCPSPGAGANIKAAHNAAVVVRMAITLGFMAGRIRDCGLNSKCEPLHRFLMRAHQRRHLPVQLANLLVE